MPAGVLVRARKLQLESPRRTLGVLAAVQGRCLRERALELGGRRVVVQGLV
jgi:hypothetical protein